MANGTTRTPEKDAQFLERLSRGASVGAAAGAGYARRSLYRWRAADAELAAAWESALETGTDGLEDEALRRALRGVAEPRFYEGEVCGYVQKYSDTLLIFLLKARRPHKYSGKAGQHLSGHLEVGWMEPGEAAPLPRDGYTPPTPDRYKR
jgi:hypothetical protein